MPQCWNHYHADRVTCCCCGLWLSKKGHEMAMEMGEERAWEWRTNVPDQWYNEQQRKKEEVVLGEGGGWRGRYIRESGATDLSCYYTLTHWNSNKDK